MGSLGRFLGADRDKDTHLSLSAGAATERKTSGIETSQGIRLYRKDDDGY